MNNEPATIYYVTARELHKLSSPAQHPQYTMVIPAGVRCKKMQVLNDRVFADVAELPLELDMDYDLAHDCAQNSFEKHCCDYDVAEA